MPIFSLNKFLFNIHVVVFFRLSRSMKIFIPQFFQIYHKWTCDSETQDTFCAVVHSCTVDDGNGDTVQMLDEDGCARDRFLLNNLEYPTDLMAGQVFILFYKV